MNCLLLVALAFFSSSISGGDAATDKIICYIATWANYRPDDGKFLIEDTDATKCTHVMYTFAGLNEDGTLRIFDSWLDIDLKGYERAIGLKNQNPSLKVLLSVGGWNEGSQRFSAIVGDPAKRSAFVQSSLSFCKTYGFDGIDMDWEYPAERGGVPADKQNLILLLQELKGALAGAGHLLTIAVSGFAREESYDVKGISDNVDIINLMDYDFHMATDGKTGANAPLYASGDDAAISIDASVKAWVGKGADPTKICLGLGFYGHSFQLADPSNHGIGAPATGPGTAGPITRQAGILGYNEICKDGWTEEWDEEGQIPYRYSGDQWVGYDNERSIIAKINYAKQNNLGGFMIWSVDTDDFHGYCGSVNPLLTTVKNNL